MPRKSYYRPYKRTYGPKAHWASNIKQGLLGSGGEILVENGAYDATPTPVILKTGNFKVQGDITVNVSNAGSVAVNVFVMYFPEGITINEGNLANILEKHPEWVLGWTAIDTPITSTGVAAGNKFSITSRLKRNLNSGDKIVIYTQGRGTAQYTYGGTYTAQFFTRAN